MCPSHETVLSKLCVLHMKTLSTFRHPAHSVPVPILDRIDREMQALRSQTTRHINGKYSKELRSYKKQQYQNDPFRKKDSVILVRRTYLRVQARPV